ncbi:MAG: LuxR C-terminal-related transcriptional regulator [Actinomycetota bacterium]
MAGAGCMRILLVEDHLLFADAIRPTLERLGVDEVEIVTRGSEAAEAVLRACPDLALVDLGLPDQGGLAVGKMILERCSGAKVVALTALSDPRVVEEAVRAGFHGYLTKDTPVGRFANALRSILDGQVVVPHRLGPASARASGMDGGFLAEQLTPRERDVLALLVQGAGSHAIASRLGISPNTVRTHVQSILTKLQVHSRLEAATFAVRHGVVEIPGAGGADVGQ